MAASFNVACGRHTPAKEAHVPQSDEPKPFGQTVRELRAARGISLRKFAALVGMSPTYLSKVERNVFPPPSEEKIVAIARELGQDADQLLALAGKVAADVARVIKQDAGTLPDFLRTWQEDALNMSARQRSSIGGYLTAWLNFATRRDAESLPTFLASLDDLLADGSGGQHSLFRDCIRKMLEALAAEPRQGGTTPNKPAGRGGTQQRRKGGHR
jgi:transcriptional regulator with XRE-family HTH domain